MTQVKSRLQLLEEFEAAPLSALFTQETICAVLACSPGKAERDRWNGSGAPFIKIGGAVRYKKSDVIAYVNAHKRQQSTTKSKTVGGC